MDELKPRVSKIEKQKIELTDEQKAEIRLEMGKCKTIEEAREHRKFLAEYYGVTVQQIAGVSAYKVKEDGSLDLKPQFGASRVRPREKTEPQRREPTSTELSAVNVIFPKIESIYDNPTKRAWRKKIKETIESEFTSERLRDARVVCLPGRALQEVTDVYLPLGIRPENITCIERDADTVRAMKESARLRQLPVKIFEGTVDEFLRGSHESVSIASFDFLGPLHEGFLESIKRLHAVDTFMIVTNFLQKREQKFSQDTLKVLTLVKRAFEQVQTKYPRPTLGSHENLISLLHLENAARATRQMKPVELSEARDEGMAMMLIASVMMGRIELAADELFAEVNKSFPFVSSTESAAFIQQATRLLSTGIEQEIKKYPKLFDKLTPRTDRDSQGKIVHYSDKGRRGFLRYFSTIVDQSLGSVSFSGLRRYEYASETAQSPYQTDIMLFTDWKHKFREKQRDAYDFIRESFRIIGEHKNDSITIQLEASGKVLLRNYSGSTAKVVVALCLNGVPRYRVALSSLQQLVNYYKHNEDKFDVATTEELFTRPRIKIEAES